MMVFVRPEVILCGWQDVEIQLPATCNRCPYRPEIVHCFAASAFTVGIRTGLKLYTVFCCLCIYLVSICICQSLLVLCYTFRCHWLIALLLGRGSDAERFESCFGLSPSPHILKALIHTIRLVLSYDGVYSDHWLREQTLISPSDSILCLVRITHARFLSGISAADVKVG